MTERLRDDPSEWQVGTWNPREAQIAAALRIADRAKKRAEELQRAALAAVKPKTALKVRVMPCGFKAVSGPRKEVMPTLGIRHRKVYETVVSLPFVTIQHGRGEP